MIKERYKALKAYLPEGITVPDSFFTPASADSLTCVFLVSCISSDRILYMDDTCKAITGYSPEHFIKKGMDFWFPLIHPEDMQAFTEKIIRAHEELLAPGFRKSDLAPLVFEYRFKHANGEWVKMRDTKLLLFTGSDVVIDMILCKFELLASPICIIKPGIEDILRTEKSCSRMLEFALVHQNAQQKEGIGQEAIKSEISTVAPPLTRREKEILRLIGEGLSTKMIADQCFISVNTVETHRRHLLEKLNAKNSMELIKQASKVYWL